MHTAERPDERIQELAAEAEELRTRLQEAEELLGAIRNGEVDALVVETGDGHRVFTLKGAEHPYRILVESMNEGAATLASDGTILYCNRRLAHTLQVPLEALIGTSILTFAQDPAAVEIVLQACLAEEYKSEVELTTGTGSSLPVMLSCRALTGADSPTVCAVITDLTETKRNRNIIASGNLAKAIIEQAGDAIIVCDRDGKIIRLSQSARGLCSGNPLSRRFDEVFVLSGCDCIPFSVDVPLGGHSFKNLEVSMRTQGEPVALLLNANPLQDNGEIVGCVVTLTDVTELRAVENALRHAHDELEQRVAERTAELAEMLKALQEKEHMLVQQSRMAAMGEMINNIAHQWRQPLNVLGLNIQRLPLVHAKGDLTALALQHSVSEAMSVIKHMSRTIDDFRDFFRTDKEKVTFRVNEVIRNAVKLIEGSYNNRQIELELDFEMDAVICGYPNEYAQAILNVLSNAKDAVEARNTPAPRVVIRTRVEDGRSVVTIRDNAGGVPEDIIFKIFDPHFTTKGTKGTGIGLFMAKNIIEKNMHGRLTVRNTGDGAEFAMEV